MASFLRNPAASLASPGLDQLYGGGAGTWSPSPGLVDARTIVTDILVPAKWTPPATMGVVAVYQTAVTQNRIAAPTQFLANVMATMRPVARPVMQIPAGRPLRNPGE